jgi:radical SAM superfamily enzyme YgiQ (UPF0313 family)
MDSEFKRRMSPSLSLLVLAAMTPPAHSVQVEDENVRPLNTDDSPDLVGITVNVDTAGRAYEIAGRYRSRGVPVILGGLHPSSQPDEAALHADSVCVGEAEHLWKQILHDAGNGGLQRRYQYDKPSDIATTPIPRWDVLDGSQYLYSNILSSSRGCSFRCEFCYNSCKYVHNVFRNRPVENVIAEIRAMKCRQAMFIDDNFIGSPANARKLVAALKPLGLTWHAAASTNIGDHPQLLDEMAQSGCRSLFIGFESINRDSLTSVGKHQNHTADYDRLIAGLHSRGIMVNASVVFGFDHDHPDVFDNTLAWLVRNKVETLTAHILTPYPGTRLFERLAAEGRIVDRDWNHYNTSSVVFQPRHMSAGQLRDGYLRLYRQFYSLGNIIRRMPSDGRRTPYLLFNFGYRKFGKVTSLAARFGLMGSFGRLARRLAYGI